MSFSAIDLTKLRVPSVVEKLDFEEIRMRLVERFAARCKEPSAMMRCAPCSLPMPRMLISITSRPM